MLTTFVCMVNGQVNGFPEEADVENMAGKRSCAVCDQ